MSFTWIPIYSEIAHKVLEFEHRQGELLTLLAEMRAEGLKVILLNDRDAGGNVVPLTEIDPFTFFASFNRTDSVSGRQAILAKIKTAWNLSSPVPDDFDGIPIANAQNSWAFAYKKDREPNDISTLWRAARAGVENKWQTFDRALFDEALAVSHTKLAKLTIGLFWLNPLGFLPCDKYTCGYFKQRGIVWERKTAVGYFSWLEKAVASAGENFPQVSFDAYAAETPGEAAYLLTWNPEKWPWSNLPESAKHVREGVQLESGDKGARWSVGNHGIKPDDRVFIVRVGTEPKGIVGSGRATSAVYDAPHYSGEQGQIGHYVDIEWDALIDPNVTAPLSITTLRQNVSSDYKWTPQLSGVAIPDGVQEKLEEEWVKHQNRMGNGVRTAVAKVEVFTKADALTGLFMTPEALDTILARLKRKKAIILQGPPGVGKTFIARRLAFALMGERDERRVAMVQFHPSYGYEDLVQGYRPSRSGGLERRDGVLHQFARLARNSPDRDWFFIIDEINRGNLAKIFGELLMLIEADKRGPAHALPLTYADGADETFHLPANLYFIGTMNTADRSLAMVDYALRRRFAFVTLEPAFDSPAFATWLKGRGATDTLISRIRANVGSLNMAIDEERDLGPRFRIGHSFFCPPDGHLPDAAWYREVIAGEIEPLLEEYFDSRERVEKLVAELLAE